MAVDAFKGYNGKTTLFDMTKHLLTYAEKAVLSPIVDRTGQSNNVDDELGVVNSITRQMASKHIKSINGRFSDSAAVAVTKGLFE